MRPDGPRDPVAGPDSGPEPPFPIKISGPVIKGFGRGSKEVNALSLHLFHLLCPNHQILARFLSNFTSRSPTIIMNGISISTAWLPFNQSLRFCKHVSCNSTLSFIEFQSPSYHSCCAYLKPKLHVIIQENFKLVAPSGFQPDGAHNTVHPLLCSTDFHLHTAPFFRFPGTRITQELEKHWMDTEILAPARSSTTILSSHILHYGRAILRP